MIIKLTQYTSFTSAFRLDRVSRCVMSLSWEGLDFAAPLLLGVVPYKVWGILNDIIHLEKWSWKVNNERLLLGCYVNSIWIRESAIHVRPRKLNGCHSSLISALL